MGRLKGGHFIGCGESFRAKGELHPPERWLEARLPPTGSPGGVVGGWRSIVRS